MPDFKYDKEKTINSILYICSKMNGCDMYKLLKILYFAEKKHIVRYGRAITGDRMSMQANGPTPSESWDLVKSKNTHEFFVHNSNFINTQKSPDLDFLSDTDIECIDESIKENKNLTFPQLKNKSHDQAYNRAKRNGLGHVPHLYIAEDEGASQEMIKYIKTLIENQNLQLNESSTW